jgi:hypothetical protein
MDVGTCTSEVGSCASEVEVDEGSEVDVVDFSVSVAAVEVVDVGRTVVKMSVDLIEVRAMEVVRAAVELLLVVVVGPSGNVPSQRIEIKVPDNARPSTPVGDTSTLLHTDWMMYWILARPCRQLGEHVVPYEKSSMTQPKTGLL